MSVWRMSVIVEMDADNIDQAESIGRQVWEVAAPAIKDIPGVKWMLPVGEFKPRDLPGDEVPSEPR